MLRGLHKLCDKGNWDEIRSSPILQRTSHDVNELSKRGGWGEWTPLHLICKKDPPLDIIETIINLSPCNETGDKAGDDEDWTSPLVPLVLCDQDIYNRIPLHYAAEKGVSDVQVLQLLILADGTGNSIVTQDVDGRTPLHLSIIGACTASATKDDTTNTNNKKNRDIPSVIEVQLMKEAILIPDGKGCLPLHYACSLYCGASMSSSDSYDQLDSLLECLMSHSLDSIVTQDSMGQTPLHTLLLEHQLSSTSSLVNTSSPLTLDRKWTMLLTPAVARIADSTGHLPFHYACKCAATLTLEVLKTIVRAYPDAVTVLVKKEDDDVSYYHPLDLLEHSRPSKTNSAGEVHQLFDEKSDWLFAFQPHVYSGSCHGKDYSRLLRFQNRIVNTMINNPTSFLMEKLTGNSDMGSEDIKAVARVWKWLRDMLVEMQKLDENDGGDDIYATSISQILRKLVEGRSFSTKTICDLVLEINPDTPIHFLCAYLLDIEGIAELVEALGSRDARFVIKTDVSGRTPLFMSLIAYSKNLGPVVYNSKVSKVLLLAATAKMTDNKGYLPIHYVSKYHQFFTIDLFQRLLELHPTSASIGVYDDEVGTQVLSIDLLNRSNACDDALIEKTDLMFSYHPMMDKYGIDEERLKRFSIVVIQELLEKGRNSTKELSNSTEPPLKVWNWMCSMRAKSVIVSKYVDIIVVAVAKSGSLPPHAVCAIVSTVSPTKPLHYACEHLLDISDLGLFESIAKTFPKANIDCDATGKTSLHIVLMNSSKGSQKAMWKVLPLLMSEKSLEQRDIHGRLPLHYACLNHMSLPYETFDAMMQLYPDSAKAIGGREVESPILILERSAPCRTNFADFTTFLEKLDLVYSYSDGLLSDKSTPENLERAERIMIKSLATLGSKAQALVNSTFVLPGNIQKLWHRMMAKASHEMCFEEAVLRILRSVVSSLPVACLRDALLYSPRAMHYACMISCGPSLCDLLHLLKEKSSSLITSRDSGGLTPLNLVLMNTPCKLFDVNEVINVLVSPETARIADNNGMLPIHYACKAIESLSIVSLTTLLLAYPEGCDKLASNAAETYPLDVLEQMRSSVAFKNISLFDKKSDLVFLFNPSLIKYKNDEQRIFRIQNGILAEMRNCFDIGDSSRTETKSNFLRRALAWICSRSVTENLFAECVERIIRQQMSSGPFDLHFASEFLFEASSTMTFKDLVAANQILVTVQDARGRTPLHIALAKSSMTSTELSDEKLLMLLDATVLELSDQSGYLPLHCACANHSAVSHRIFEILLQTYPQSAYHKSNDDLQFSPIEILENTMTLGDNQTPISAYILKRDLVFSFNPWAGMHSTDEQLVQRFEKKIVEDALMLSQQAVDDEASGNKCLILKEPLNLIWAWLCTAEDPRRLLSDCVERIINSISPTKTTASSLLIRQLASMNDTRSGQPLFSCASERCSALLIPWLRFAGRYEILPTSIRSTNWSVTIQAITRALTGEEKGIADSDASCNIGRVVQISFISSRELFSKYETMLSLALESGEPSGCTSSLIPILRTYNIDHIGRPECTVDDLLFERDVRMVHYFQCLPHSLSQYRYAVVHDAKGLSDDCLALESSNSLNCMWETACRIGHGLRLLHQNGLMHGGICTTSIFHRNGKLMLTDITTACFCGDTLNEHYGGFTIGSTIPTSAFPPEMIVKLTASEVTSYITYWSPLRKYAECINGLLPGDLTIIQREVDGFLGINEFSSSSSPSGPLSGFSSIWNHIECNASLWKILQPRQFNSDFYVSKCFWYDESPRRPTRASRLPFKLQMASANSDVWSFGVMLFELYSGESLFSLGKTKCLVKASDFHRLYSWTNSVIVDEMRKVTIQDPLARDLLSGLLTRNDVRPKSMAEVVEHPFFYPLESIRRKRETNRVLADEEQQKIQFDKEKRTTEEASKQAREKFEWITKNTIDIKQRSTSLEAKLLNSTWNQWREMCDKPDFSFPVCIMALPYRLERDDLGNLLSPKGKHRRAIHFGNILAHLMLSISLSAKIVHGPKVDDNSVEGKIQKYNEMNKVHSASASTKGILDICRDISLMATNAEDLLAVVFSEMNLAKARSYARSVIAISLSPVVDIDACRLIVRHAKLAESAFEMMSTSFQVDNTSISRSHLDDHVEMILGSSFCKERVRRKKEIEGVLLSLLRTFMIDPATCARHVAMKALDDLTKAYVSTGKMYVYLVDEISCRPVDGDGYPREIDVSVESVQAVIHCLRVSIKSLCSISFSLGLAAAVALPPGQIPKEWTFFDDRQKALCHPADYVGEFDVVADITARIGGLAAHNNTASSDSILNWNTFLERVDPHRTYSGLKRAFAGPASYLWASLDNIEKLKMEVNADIESFFKRDETCEGQTPTQSLNNRLNEIDEWGDTFWYPASKSSTHFPVIAHLAELQRKSGETNSVTVAPLRRSSAWDDDTTAVSDDAFFGQRGRGDSLSFSSASTSTNFSPVAIVRHPLSSLCVADSPRGAPSGFLSPRGIPTSPQLTAREETNGKEITSRRKLVNYMPICRLTGKSSPSVHGGDRLERRAKSSFTAGSPSFGNTPKESPFEDNQENISNSSVLHSPIGLSSSTGRTHTANCLLSPLSARKGIFAIQQQLSSAKQPQSRFFNCTD